MAQATKSKNATVEAGRVGGPVCAHGRPTGGLDPAGANGALGFGLAGEGDGSEGAS